MDDGSFDPYINYVKTQHARGLHDESILHDLLSKGFNPETARWLMQAALPASVLPSPTIEAAGQPVADSRQFATAPSGSILPAPADFSPHDGVRTEDTRASWTQRFIQPAPARLAAADEKKEAPRPSAVKGYALTILLCVLPALLIMFDMPFTARFGTTIRALLTWGDIAGVIGLVLYVMDLLLATRMRWIEDLFGGLNRVYVAHAIFGGGALIAIMIHPLLLGIRYLPLGMKSVGGFFLPNMQYISNIYGMISLVIILVLIILTLYIKLPYRLWLTTHKYMGLAYIFLCAHIVFEPNAITPNPVARWYLIVLMIVGMAAYFYRTLFPNILVRHYTYVIEAAKEKTTGIMEITLRPTDKVMYFEPGQFVFMSFHADGLSPEWHPFTISSAPRDGSFKLAVKSLGAYTETITRLLPKMVGMTAQVEGAYGRFSFRNFKNVNQVWIAGGIGITPFLSMAQALGKGQYNIDLYYSVSSESELIDIDILARQQSQNPGQVFRVIPFITDKYQRHLGADIIAATTKDLANRDILICGPEAMMEDIRRQLIAKGAKKYRIHTEEFSIL